MTADPVLTLAWLALAHLVTDFVIQTNRVATEKFGFGRKAYEALGLHWLGAAICLLPLIPAFGLPGLAFAFVVSASHALIDRAKIVWTMRVEAAAVAEALARHEGPAPAASLGTAWTPMPAFLFALDQLAHVLVTLAAWAIFLATAPVLDGFGSAARSLIGAGDAATAHRVALTLVVLLDLAIINIRAGSLFVSTLVHPREAVTGEEDTLPEVATGQTEPTDARPELATAEVTTAAAVATNGSGQDPPATITSTARVGATIGVLERLLIVGLVLTNATAAVGFVLAAKTIARFKQLDDRQFAEYYLLGTLASVSVALGSAFVAAAALAAP
jgi:hypothetical protein